MLNIRELEKRWLHYKIKSYIPHTVIAVSLIVIILVTAIITTSTPQKKEHKQVTLDKTLKKPVTLATPTIDSKNSIQETNITQQNTNQTNIKLETIAKAKTINTDKEQKLILEPSMHFMKHIQSEEQQPYYKTLNETKTVKKEKIKRNKIAKQQSTVEEEYMNLEGNKKTRNIQQPVQQEPAKKQLLTIKRRESQNDIKEIITRFKKNNNPALSLFVAKKYYEIGNYEQAYNYALITNGINNDIEESWLIFAKSLAKLGKRDMAVKTLREYINYSHSGNAKILLNDIESGKFR
ncbi:tetratricopeptide repeat protein [Sulfurimonas paralvinellae]|uniref:Transformation system protein n=1 Tax=Sulfurimonas paralvinellae TaxID=317658 RepID=A0A7M1B7D4_9BACT|nr:hypothetical protein [Sulfurimonas paralvinellae]QOP45416.1 hypothetical protein FM071_03630 [Sulfurimonas paralvinellae]